VLDLSRANNDMNNLLAGTGVGTLFVDYEVRIARFTPAVTGVINLIASDIGRPLGDVAANLVDYDRLVPDIREVLRTLAPKEAEVRSRSGVWYLMRILPYRTMENLIEGAVVTLVDISARKQTEESLRRSEERLKLFINQAYAGVAEVSLQGQYTFVNDRLCELLGYARDELLQRHQRELTEPQDVAASHALYDALARGGPGFHVDKRYVRRDGRRLWVHERVSAIRDRGAHPSSFLALSFELPDRQQNS
jgi:two-component system CheB/CheR fusion protein